MTHKATAVFMIAAGIMASCSTSDIPQQTETDISAETTVSAPQEKTCSLSTVIDDKYGVYFIDCYNDYKVDEYLKAGITDVDGFDAWLTEELTQGVPTGAEAKKGCSSFSAEDADGHRIFGRNYDMGYGSSAVVRTRPGNGYASISIADLGHINIGSGYGYMIDDEEAEKLLCAAPWAICDGINEKGLGVSLLSLDEEHTVKDTDKDDLLIYAMIRVILDKCAGTDEAVQFLSGYDAYSPGRHTYHLFITDRSGSSAVVEWLDGEMYTTAEDAVTNFVMHDTDYSDDYDMRYTRMHNRLADGALTDEDAMALLQKVSQGSYTRWSAVYDLDDLVMTVCFGHKYDESYTFSLE